MKKPTKATARKVLALVDQGLSSGLGTPEPGKMCVEAAVCYALGEPHGDNPSCVSSAVRSFKIRLNDAYWSSNEARAKGMRRLAIVQLGSAGVINDVEFAKRLAKWAKEVIVPRARYTADAADAAARYAADAADADAAAADADAAAADAAARYAADAADAAARYAADAADAAARYAADAAARYARYAARYADAAADRDKSLAQSAEEVVQILVEMGSPGAKWLDLAPLIVGD